MNRTMHRLLQWVVHAPTDAAPPATLLIRLMAGGVFVGEGLLKCVFPAGVCPLRRLVSL
jgi:pyridoxal biosynthesis lyase PdxS